MGQNLGFFVSEAWRDFRRRFFSHLVSVFSIALLLLFLALLLSVGAQLQSMVELLRSEAEISLFLKDDVTEKEMAELSATLSKWEGVTGVHIVSQEEALGRMNNILGAKKDSLAAFEGFNPFMAYLEVSVMPEKAGEISRNASHLPFVDGVRDNQQTLDKLVRLTATLRVAEWITACFVGIIMMIVVSHLVNLAIVARREEMEIYRLLGAGEGFVVMPFVLQGGFMGLAGGVLAFLHTLLLFPFLFTRLQGALPFLPMVSGFSVAVTIGPLIVGLGLLFGLLGSLMAIKP